MISYLANPKRYLRFARYATPVFGIVAAIGFVIGLYLALLASPEDYQQGHTVRIMYVHVPAAWCAQMAYTALAMASLVSFIWRHTLADIAARAFAVPGAAFTFLALVTGSLWGKPTWNTYWQWDGRMTSVLILLFIYIAYLAIWAIIEDKKHAARLASIFAMVGFINIPIIKFSVDWWNSLHQPATFSSPGAPGSSSEILLPLMTMMVAYTALFGWLSLRQITTEVLRAQSARKRQNPGAKVTIEAVDA